MRTSESQVNIAKALFEARKEYPKIAKTKQGQAGHRQFKYAPMEDILDTIGATLEKFELLVTQPVDGHSVVTRVEHISSGEWREATMPVNEEHANMQSYGIELTYRRRYAIQGILGIITEEDTDGAGTQKRKGADHTRNANGTQQGPGAISATTGARERMPEDRANELEEIALEATESARNGKELRAYEVCSKVTDADEKTYLWSLLDSKVRSAIKRVTPAK